MEEIEQRLLKVEQVTGELHTVLMGPGPGRTNGVNGTLRQLKIDFDKAMEWAHDIWNNKRRVECIGMTAIDDVKKDIANLRKEQEEMAAAKLNLRGVYVMGILQFVGAVLVALIASGRL